MWKIFAIEFFMDMTHKNFSKKEKHELLKQFTRCYMLVEIQGAYEKR